MVRAKDLEWECRAQFSGVLRWMCPRCGQCQMVKLELRSFEFLCKKSSCKQRYIFGLRLLLPTKVKCIIPRDRIFPIVVPEEYTPGEVSCVVEDEPEDLP